MKKFLTNKNVIYYEEHLNGGGTTFGIDAMKMESIVKHIKKGKILEMCSGPGFIGFYLNFNGYADELWLSDINEENIMYINKTIDENKITNTKFIHSDSFKSFNLDVKFDTIVSNPPHFGYMKECFNDYYSKLLSVDLNLEFHKKFFEEAQKYMDENSKIIIIEYFPAIPPSTLKKLLPISMVDIDYISIDSGIFKNYYASIIKLKDSTYNKSKTSLI